MSDVAKWDSRYLRKEHGNDLTPDPLLVEYKDLFKKTHLVVDLACGTGRNSVYLAKLGCFAVALDCSREALRRCQSLAQQSNLNLLAVAADLEHNAISTGIGRCIHLLQLSQPRSGK